MPTSGGYLQVRRDFETSKEKDNYDPECKMNFFSKQKVD